MDWTKNLDLVHLMSHAPQAQVLNFGDNYTIDFAASLMTKGGPLLVASLKPNEKVQLLKGFQTRSESYRPPKDWWPKVKEEFHIFLCTNDKRYADLRRKLKSAREAASATILSIITAAIASNLGFAAGSITGFVALCLYAVLKIGKEAYCAAKI